jgi:hypothetical protein
MSLNLGAYHSIKFECEERYQSSPKKRRTAPMRILYPSEKLRLLSSKNALRALAPLIAVTECYVQTCINRGVERWTTIRT